VARAARQGERHESVAASSFGGAVRSEVEMGHEEHRKAAPARLEIFVVTASDTRGEAEDDGGRFLREGIAAAGHALAGYRIVKDDPAAIRGALEEAARAGADAVLVNGGTGIAGRDRTYEAVAGLLEKRLDGFGELFRMLSYAEIGAAAMLSRAVAGVWEGRAVFSMPGSPAAVRLAWEKLIGPELPHVVRELRKDRG
jgi:molybdenum cofactor biosynthesis protein B